MNPVLSVVIPAYARPGPLGETLRSLAHSATPFPWEIVLVDDGSPEPLAPLLQRDFPSLPLRIVRQENTGLIGAKNRGLREARGELVLFLDSDDLVHPEKLQAQVDALRHTGADVSYSDTARLPVGQPLVAATPAEPYPPETSVPTPAHLFLLVQPAPHSPMFRRAYLERCLERPIVRSHPIFNPVGEVWMYYNLAPHAARYVRTTGALAIVGEHAGPRITDHWERQGIAATTLMQCFLQRCPDLPHTPAARELVARIAFQGWRALPPGFPRAIADVRLAVWREAVGERAEAGAGPGFRLLAALIGTVPAARLLKRLRQRPYAEIATMPLPEVMAFQRRAEAALVECLRPDAVPGRPAPAPQD